MKNQIIKKIMAYLLVGAMVISTPITASANELENAYSSNTADGEGSNTDTDTSTNTSGEPVDAPVLPVIKDNSVNILGLQLDKETLELEVGDKAALHVRVLLDDYDANDEDLAWANIDAEKRAEIEGSIHWISMDPKVATAKLATKAEDPDLNQYITEARNTDAIIEAIGNGQTEVVAWIEADGKAYENAPNMPTAGDLMAKATVTVRGGEVKIEFSEMVFANQKRTYDLQKYTIVNGIPATEATEKITYSGLTGGSKIKAALSEDGKFTIKTVAKTSDFVPDNEVFTFKAVAESGKVVDGTIKFQAPVPVSSYDVVDHVGLDYPASQTVELTNIVTDEKNTPTTDDFNWTVKNTKIVTVSLSDNGQKATIHPIGVGTTDITITTTTNAKNTKKTIKVYVNAIPATYSIHEGITYTGKPVNNYIYLYDKEDNRLAESAFTYKWSVASGSKDNGTVKKYGKTNGVTITPKTVLNKGILDDNMLKNGVSFQYICSITYKEYDWDSSKKKVTTQSKKTNDITCSYTIKQSDIADITVSELTMSEVAGGYTNKNIASIIGKLPNTKSDTRKTYVSKEYWYLAEAYKVDGLKTVRDEEQDGAISWSVSGKAATIESDGYFTPLAAGKTNITASYISLKYDKNGKAKAQVKKKTIPVQIIQNATAIGFQKPVQVVQEKANGQTVAVKISSVTPKKATYNITSWKAIAYNSETGNMEILEDGNVKAKNASNITLDAKDKNGNFRKDAKVIIPGTVKANTVIKIAAYTDGGVVATGYIYVTNPTQSVVGASELTKITDNGVDASKDNKGVFTISLGTTYQILPRIKVNGTETNTTAWIEGTKDKSGNPLTYATEPVTYSVDKTSAKFIRVTNDGKIIPLQLTGTKKVTVTIKTLSGKSGKVTLLVK